MTTTATPACTHEHLTLLRAGQGAICQQCGQQFRDPNGEQATLSPPFTGECRNCRSRKFQRIPGGLRCVDCGAQV